MDVGYAEEAVAEGVDHIQDGVEVGDALPELREQFYRVEHAAEVGQRGEDEGGDDGDVVELLGEHAVEAAADLGL